MTKFALAGLLLSVATPAIAAPAEAAKGDTPSIGKGLPKPDMMLAVVDKLFPPQPEPDPARLALARTSVATMWPDGAYGRMMTDFVGNMFDSAMKLKMSELASLDGKAGAKPAAAASAEDPSLHDIAAGSDAHFDERVTAIRAVVTDEMGKVSAVIDPRMRDGMARAMARRFDAQQLNDINAFFATPSGRAFAGQYMQLWLDPDTIRSLVGSMPEMMKLLPGMMERVKAADAKYPRPAKPKKTTKK